MATTVLSHEVTVEVLSSFKLSRFLLSRLVSRTRRPEDKIKKSSLEMRSPGLEVKLVDCIGIPSRGKL